jgi:hypothetical protein
VRCPLYLIHLRYHKLSFAGMCKHACQDRSLCSKSLLNRNIPSTSLGIVVSSPSPRASASIVVEPISDLPARPPLAPSFLTSTATGTSFDAGDEQTKDLLPQQFRPHLFSCLPRRFNSSSTTQQPPHLHLPIHLQASIMSGWDTTPAGKSLATAHHVCNTR